MEGASKLKDRIFELRTIFDSMTVTEADRETDIYKGLMGLPVGLADPAERSEWLERSYLRQASERALKRALSRGDLRTWGYSKRAGTFVEIDHDVAFAPNKWDQRAALSAGIYRAQNVRNDHGDDLRPRDDIALWVKDADWVSTRDTLVADRMRAFGSELPVAVQLALGIGVPRHTIPPAPELPTREPQLERFSDSVWAGMNSEWFGRARESWPSRDGDSVFLGEAVLQLGRARFGEHWVDDIPDLPRPPRAVPERPANESGTWIEGFLNGRAWAQAATSRARWPMFDAVVDELIVAAQAGRLRCFTRAADHLELEPITKKAWRLPESIAVFKRCRIDPERPFGGVPSYRSGRTVFVHADDLRTLIDGQRLNEASVEEHGDSGASGLQKRFSRSSAWEEISRWYLQRIASAPETGYSRNEDEQAARSVGIGRDRVRELRRQYKPAHWREGGRPSQKTRRI